MNTKNGILSFLCLMLTFSMFAQGQERKNIIGAGAGYCPERIVWIGNPLNLWVDINASPILQAFYARQVLPAVRLGGYLEYENATFKSTNNKASRYNAGSTILGSHYISRQDIVIIPHPALPTKSVTQRKDYY